MNYVVYDQQGTISQWGIGQPPPHRPSLEYDMNIDPALYYVDVTEQQMVPKDRMLLSFPMGPTPADGITEAVIDGLPVDTVCDFYVSDTAHRIEVQDGNLEMTLETPQIVVVRLWHSRFYHPPIELEFV